MRDGQPCPAPCQGPRRESCGPEGQVLPPRPALGGGAQARRRAGVVPRSAFVPGAPRAEPCPAPPPRSVPAPCPPAGTATGSRLPPWLPPPPPRARQPASPRSLQHGGRRDPLRQWLRARRALRSRGAAPLPQPRGGHRHDFVLLQEVTAAGTEDLPGQIGDAPDHMEPRRRQDRGVQ